MSHLQLILYLSTHLTKFKKSKFKQLRNKSTVAASSGNKRLNDMTLPSFDSSMSHQRRAETLDA